MFNNKNVSKRLIKGNFLIHLLIINKNKRKGFVLGIYIFDYLLMNQNYCLWPLIPHTTQMDLSYLSTKVEI